MITALLAYLLGALVGLAIVLLLAERFAVKSRETAALITDFNAEHPRRHLRVVRDGDGQAS
jgi:hypothetical protein